MFIDIRKTPEGHSSADAQLSFPEALREAGRVVEEFPASISVSRYDGYVFVKVEYEGEVTRECDRCLKEYTVKVPGSVEFTLQSAEVDEDVASEEVDTYVFETEDDQIDFSQTVYDDMMIRLPSKSLCDENCPGFEKTAESVEDELQSDEQEPAIDPRWAALGKLKK